MWVEYQQHAVPELGRVGKQRDSQHKQVPAGVQPALEPNGGDDCRPYYTE
jgi:hypothetical protein